MSKDQALTTDLYEHLLQSSSLLQQQLTTTEGELAAQKEAKSTNARELDAKEQELAKVRREFAGKDAIIHTHETTIVTLRSQTTIVSDRNTNLEYNYIARVGGQQYVHMTHLLSSSSFFDRPAWQ